MTQTTEVAGDAQIAASAAESFGQQRRQIGAEREMAVDEHGSSMFRL
jgi:hypothetical protein